MLKLTDFLAKWVSADPGRPLYTFLNRAAEPVCSYTYATFHTRTNGLASVLIDEIGVSRDEPILLAYPPGLEMIAAFMACVKAGAIPVPVPPPVASRVASCSERLSLIVASSGAKRALTDRTILAANLPRHEYPGVHSTDVLRASLHGLDWIATNGLGERSQYFLDRSGDLLFLQYTSGSTQTPRGVMVSHENVIANCLAALDRAHIGVSWLPHFHDLGLIAYYLFPLIHGGSVFHFSPADFVRRPLLWLEAISRFSATATSAPNFAFEYCLCPDKIPDDVIPSLRLNTLRLMMNGSEPVRPDTMERFLARFAIAGLAPNALSASYGLAENTLAVSTGGRTHLRANKELLSRNKLRVVHGGQRVRTGIPIASCGKPLRGVNACIVSPDTRSRVADGEVGEIWLAGRSKALGYWKRPDLNLKVFQARINGDQSSTEYLRTGDMGFIHDGELYVCGRVKDMIIVRGINIYPSDVEALVARTLAPVRHATVVAFGFGATEEVDDGVVVLIELRPGDAMPDLPNLHRNIRAHLHAPVLTLACVPKSALARTSSGKTSRFRYCDMWRNHAIRVINRFDPPVKDEEPSNFPEHVKALVEQSADNPAMTLGELGLDSFELVALSLEIERFLAEKIGPGLLSDEAFNLGTLQSMTVGRLKQVAEDVNDGRTSMIKLCYQETAQLVAARDIDQMRTDAVLPAHILSNNKHLAGFSQGTAPILLTGATGFVGSHLLAALLRVTDQKIVVLARGHDDDHARRRVAAALALAQGRGSDCLKLGSRIEVLNSDIAMHRLGLSEQNWSALADGLGAVIHCGAEVDYVKSYSELRGANVIGTSEILNLCCMGARKILHHISTTFIFGWSTDPSASEKNCNPAMRGLDFGYSQTKWVSEQLVIKARERGLDARIYRPSFLTASRLGHWVAGDVFIRTLAYMIRHRLSVIAENQVSVLPVDVCAQNIVGLALLDDPGAHTFHLTSDEYYTMQTVCQCITDQFGYEFEYVDVETFIEHMNRFCTPDNILFPLLAFFRTNRAKLHGMRHKRYDNTNFRLARTKLHQNVPKPDLADTMRWAVQFLLRERLIPPLGSTIRHGIQLHARQHARATDTASISTGT